MKKTISTFIIFAMVGAISLPARAALIEIQFIGLDFRYDGTDIFDAGGRDGGIGDTAQSDRLTSMAFLTDSTLVGVLQTDVYADFLLRDVPPLPVDGGLVTNSPGSGFGFDLLIESALGGWGLGLDVDKYQVFYSGNELSIAATELASNLRTQNLPFGLTLSEDDRIKIIISSANLSNVTDDGSFLTGFRASGTGNVRGTALVPEPTSASGLLAAVGLAGLALRRFV